MKFFYSPYTLESNFSLNALSAQSARKGALIKVSFDSGLDGFADCHPWPELGDLSIEKQLQQLRQGEWTPLTHSAVDLARMDALGRSEGKNLLIDQPPPRSHFLINQIAEWTGEKLHQRYSQGFTHFKIKLGRNIDEEVERLHSLFLNTPMKIRLDFNESLTIETCVRFLKSIEILRQSIDFIEDPFPFDVEEWKKIQEEGWKLACDRHISHAVGFRESAHFLVVKPALHPLEKILKWKKEAGEQEMIVTSYLGHPLEQASAAYVAAQVDFYSSSLHGLMTHFAYTPTQWSQQLNWNGCEFHPLSGTGFGFDREIAQLDWRPVMV